VLGNDIPAVFSDTGLEFPELREFVKTFDNVVWLKPKMNFKKVVDTYGFPMISKETALKVRKLRHGKLSPKYRNYLLNGDERGKFGVLAKKWRFFLTTEYDISEVCCEKMKKEPFRRYHKQTGRVPYIGVTQDESYMREHQYAHTGCNVYDAYKPKSQPLGFWTKQDIMRYVVENQQKYDAMLRLANIKITSRSSKKERKAARKYVTINRRMEICSVYGEIKQKPDGTYYLTGEQRTGCIFCGFGCHLEPEPNRFQRLEKSHPNQHCYCMNKLTNNGVTYAEALDEAMIPYTNGGQMELEEYLRLELK
jgi:3'-phosphoadenosine 5'-phosphosulfate sulfotransferase (PAPS reductase)/FAD synthetase